MSNSINVEFPVSSIGQPTEGDGYMTVARDLLQGVEALSTLPHIPKRSCALIAAHALECTLKAFLWHKGRKKEINDPCVRHNLVLLWKMAYKEGLSIPEGPPDWCTILSLGHNREYYFRYQMGQGKTIVNGGDTPALRPMADELKKLIEIVGLAVKG